MRLRPLIVGAALGGMVAASPAVATHAPYYLWMGIVEISSTTGGVNVSYTYSGFAPSNWSGGCFVPDPYGPFPDIATTVSCTPPAPPVPFDVNYCGVVTVVVSSSAPVGSPGAVTGSSSCNGMSASASAPAGTASASGPTVLRGLQATFPWLCSAEAPPTVHPWTVRCTVSH